MLTAGLLLLLVLVLLLSETFGRSESGDGRNALRILNVDPDFLMERERKMGK